MTTLVWFDAVRPARTGVDDVVALAERVAAADGTDAFSDPTHRDLAAWRRGEERPTSHGLLALDGERRLVGYAHVDAASADDVVAEGAVDPERRREGVGAALATEVLAA